MSCRHLYPLNVYACPAGHDEFYCYARGNAVAWSCPTCGSAGKYVRCEGEGMTYIRAPRPVKGVVCRQEEV